MRSFPIPMELTEEEKIMGGVLSKRQIAYVLGGIVIAAVLFGIMPKLWLRFVSAILGLGIAGALSFVKIDDIGLDRYLYQLVRWGTSPKIIR